MYQDAEGRARHDARDPNAWGEEMLHFLREDDRHFERWRHEQLAQMDEDYRRWRHERFGDDVPRWQESSREPFGRGAAPDDGGDIAMPLPGDRLTAQAIEPDAEAAGHREALRSFHGD